MVQVCKEARNCMNNDYVLTIRISIAGLDDCDARMQAREKISKMLDFIDPQKAKLQEVFSHRAPRNIRLW